MRTIPMLALGLALLLPTALLAEEAETFPDRGATRGKVSQPGGKLPSLRSILGKDKPATEAAEPSNAMAGKPAKPAPITGTGEGPAERVTGIGGFFFRSKDPDALSQWYSANLGVDVVPTDYDTMGWQQEPGTTIFAPFQQDTDYFGDETQMWMINFRVRDLSAMVAQLRANGIEVEVDPETYPNGRFARLADPEGNPIQLWQPAAAALRN